MAGAAATPVWTMRIEAVGLILRGRTARTAGPIAAIVGTVLSVVNQAEVVIGGHATSGTWVRIVVNYLVPFVVASVAYLSSAGNEPARLLHQIFRKAAKGGCGWVSSVTVMRGRWWVLGAVLLLAVAGCGSGGQPSGGVPASAVPVSGPVGKPLSGNDIRALAAQFGDQPLTGGQTAPRLYRWVNDRVAVFLQFDSSDLAKVTALRYIGVSVKGVFCAADQPGGPDGGFTHFHRVEAAEYAQGHGGSPGAQGYWLSWAAVDRFAQRDGRQVAPGVDYQFSPTPPPACGPNPPKPDFVAPGAKPLSKQDIAALAGLFGDNLLTGGQTAPRQYRWVNQDVAIFAQFDKATAAEATALRYVGISARGEFCKSKQPSKDFPHFHRVDASEYAKGHGQAAGDRGYWLLWLATDSFAQRDGRQVHPGADREFSPTPPPEC